METTLFTHKNPRNLVKIVLKRYKKDFCAKSDFFGKNIDHSLHCFSSFKMIDLVIVGNVVNVVIVIGGDTDIVVVVDVVFVVVVPCWSKVG